MCKTATGEELRALRLQVSELRHAKEQAEAGTRAHWMLVCKIAHELRTPLNAIVGFAELARGGDRHVSAGGLPANEWVGHIAFAGWHMSGVIDTLMSLGPLADGRLRGRSESLDLRRTLEEAIRVVEPAARHRGICVDVQAPSLTWVRADACGLRQVLVNVLSNAVKYNVDAGRVWVSVQPGADVEIAIRDSGPGLTAAQRERLFQPFDRLGAERSKVKGHGLGLMITKELVEAMGGEIRVESPPDGGCAFRIILPGTPAAAAA